MFETNNNQPRLTKEKRKVAVLGIGRSCGVSTVAIMLAYYIKKKGNRVSFCEITNKPNKASIYYKNFFDKNMEHDQLIDFYDATRQGKPIHRLHNFYKDVNWAITLPNTRCMNGLNGEEKKHLINNLLGEYVICDVDFDCEIGEEKILEEFDLVIALVDPLPSKVMENFDAIRRLKELEFNGYNVMWVLNFYNRGIHTRDLVKSLRLEKYDKIPLIERERIYDCEYRCKEPILKKEEKAGFDTIFAKAIEILERSF